MSALVHKITSFDCDIQHIMGEENFLADFLSRDIRDDTTNDDDKDAEAKNVPKVESEKTFNTGLDSLSLDVKKNKQTNRAGKAVPIQKTEQSQSEASADEQEELADSNQNKNNNNNKQP